MNLVSPYVFCLESFSRFLFLHFRREHFCTQRISSSSNQTQKYKYYRHFFEDENRLPVIERGIIIKENLRFKAFLPGSIVPIHRLKHSIRQLLQAEKTLCMLVFLNIPITELS
uniref:Uncharacterized protein n=1 Tax=Lepeophtheirus salmonis TaxID=72036 RepID=A0A0K2UPP3_LEPSM